MHNNYSHNKFIHKIIKHNKFLWKINKFENEVILVGTWKYLKLIIHIKILSSNKYFITFYKSSCYYTNYQSLNYPILQTIFRSKCCLLSYMLIRPIISSTNGAKFTYFKESISLVNLGYQICRFAINIPLILHNNIIICMIIQILNFFMLCS